MFEQQLALIKSKSQEEIDEIEQKRNELQQEIKSNIEKISQIEKELAESKIFEKIN